MGDSWTDLQRAGLVLVPVLNVVIYLSLAVPFFRMRSNFMIRVLSSFAFFCWAPAFSARDDRLQARLPLAAVLHQAVMASGWGLVLPAATYWSDRMPCSVAFGLFLFTLAPCVGVLCCRLWLLQVRYQITRMHAVLRSCAELPSVTIRAEAIRSGADPTKNFWVMNRRFVTPKALAVIAGLCCVGCTLTTNTAFFLVHPATFNTSVVVDNPECPAHTPVLFW
jgi:hypothetical protein